MFEMAQRDGAYGGTVCQTTDQTLEAVVAKERSLSHLLPLSIIVYWVNLVLVNIGPC